MWLLALKIVFQVLAVGAMVLVNLLDYVTRDKRTRRFKMVRRTLFIVSGIFLIVSIIVVILDDLKDNDKFHRLSQPIRDIYVSFRVDIPITHPALDQYRTRVNSAIAEMLQLQEVRYGSYIRRQSSDGRVLSLGIPTQSELFPNRGSEPLAYYLLNFVGLRFKVYKGQSTYSPDLGDPDLMFYAFVSIDGSPKWTEGHATLSYDFEKSQLYVSARDIFCPSKNWISNGKIVSIPDLLESMLIVWFDRRLVMSNDPDVHQYAAEARNSISFHSATIQVNGKQHSFSQQDLQGHDDPEHGQVYMLGPGKLK